MVKLTDIKSESAGMELNDIQKGKIKLLEQQKDELVRLGDVSNEFLICH